jgi:AcrR family transcriptional regulator
MATPGQPKFQPTDKQRGQVEAMVRYGIPEAEIARALEISKTTLLRHFREEIDSGATKANAQVGEFIFSTIIGLPIPGRPPVTDERARAGLAIFWAKTRMNWKETPIHEHKDLDSSNARERVARRLDRIAAAIEKSSISPAPE